MALAIVGIWLLAMPALVGVYLRHWTPNWLDQAGLAEGAHFEPGWFASSLSLRQADWAVRLRARHFPAPGRHWLTLDGLVHSPFSSQALRVGGRLRLSGAIAVEMDGSELAAAGVPAVRIENLRIGFNQSGDEHQRLRIDVTGLQAGYSFAPTLSYRRIESQWDWQALGPDHGRLSTRLILDDAQAPGLELRLAGGPLNPDILGALIDAAVLLARSRPDSFDRRMASLALINGWQQLRDGGLSVDRASLVLGDRAHISARWPGHPNRPSIEGQGDIATVEDALRPILTVLLGPSQTSADEVIDYWQRTATQRGWLHVDGHSFQARYPAKQ